MVERFPSRQRRSQCKTNKGMIDVSSMWGTTGYRTMNAIRGSVPGAA